MEIHKSKICEMIESKVPFSGGVFLKEAIYSVKRQSLLLEFVTKETVTASQKEALKTALDEILPSYIRQTDFTLKRSYFDGEILKNEIKDYLLSKHKSVSSCVTVQKISISEEVCIVILFVDPLVKDYADRERLNFLISDHLENNFFEHFEVNLNFSQVVESKEIKEKVTAYKPQTASRKIQVADRVVLIGKEIEGDPAYIIDAENPQPEVVLCGILKFFSVRETQKGKPMARFVLSDFTSTLPCLHFAAESSREKLTKLSDGVEVLVSGELKDDERSGLTLFVKSISLCTLPKNFTPEPLPSKPAFPDYINIFPKKFETAKQQDLFQVQAAKTSQRLLSSEFVAFDLETTGIAFDLDSIVEIAAVKIKDGKIVESFETFVNPKRKIPPAATAVNNITDDMVQGAPEFKDVLPDFYKFTRGTELIAHNIDFDIRFVQFFAKKQGYFFENKLNDTLAIAREKLKGLHNYKLETVAAHLKIDPGDKHRALSDTLTCAEAFIKIMNTEE